MNALTKAAGAVPTSYSFEHLLIGGIWRGGNAKSKVTDLDPFTGGALAEFAGANVDDIADAFTAAARAQPVDFHAELTRDFH